MADSELQSFTDELTDPAAADIIYAVDDPAGTPASRKLQVSNLVGYLVTTAGDILYATAARTLARLGIGTAAQVLKVNAGATAPTWGTCPTADVVTTAGDVLYATGADAVARLAIGSATQVLKGGTTAPVWGVCPTADVATTAGDTFYATGADTPARLAIGTAGQVLKVNAGATAPVWGSGGKSRLSLPPSAGYPPDDSAGSAAAQLQMKITSDTTDPQVRWPELLFDTTTEEHWYWTFAMPDNYGSAPIVDVYYKCTSATSGTAAFNCKLMAVTSADAQDVDADEFAAEQTAASETVPGTAGYMSVLSITVANADSVAANDLVVLGVFRDVSADNAAGDLEVPMVILRYTGA